MLLKESLVKNIKTAAGDKYYDWYDNALNRSNKFMSKNKAFIPKPMLSQQATNAPVANPKRSIYKGLAGAGIAAIGAYLLRNNLNKVFQEINTSGRVND